MPDRLKIYACSGIGDVSTQKAATYDYWLDNTNSLTNTQAVNTLLAKINLNIAEVENLELLKEDVIERLNAIDLFVVCLYVAQDYASHYTKLQKAGAVIGNMLLDGLFYSESLDNKERDANLDELIRLFDERFMNDGEIKENAEFTKWWDENVVSRNRIGLSAEEREVVQQTLNNTQISGIGKELDWHDNKELSKYLSDGASYFLFTYFTQAQLNSLPNCNRRIISLKKTQQLRTYNYCKSLFVGIYGSEKEMKDIIRAGIIGRFKVTPEDVCLDIVNGKRSVKSVEGLAVSAIVTIVVTAISAVVTIITAICKAVANSKASQYAAIDEKAVKASTPNGEDFDGLLGNTQKTAGSSGLLPFLILGGVVLVYFFNKK